MAKRSKKKIRVPLRPFQAPVKYIDVTKELPYEKQWFPLIPGVKFNQEKKRAFGYDRSVHDRGIYEKLQD